MPPLGCEAPPTILQAHRVTWIHDCFAAERGQAPSPQQLIHSIERDYLGYSGGNPVSPTRS
ncbi:hypothetical protein BZL43_26645 [Pseudomonas sp. PICF141]|nr:hypothetical protein BZL43_26645 [Pseudomonas sp. PICF141]